MGQGVRGRNRPQRLDQLEARLGIRAIGTDDPGVDWSRLTEAEQQELARLAGKTRWLPTGRWDFSELDDSEPEQLRALVVKGQRARDAAADTGTLVERTSDDDPVHFVTSVSGRVRASPTR
jgi:hypothetical protein